MATKTKEMVWLETLKNARKTSLVQDGALLQRVLVIQFTIPPMNIYSTVLFRKIEINKE
jgi:hypothetical protein